MFFNTGKNVLTEVIFKSDLFFFLKKKKVDMIFQRLTIDRKPIKNVGHRVAESLDKAN